jgi:hypothetical protein
MSSINIYVNKKIENNREFIEDCIAKMLPLEYVMKSTSLSYTTIKKYFPHYNGNKKRTKDIIAEIEYNKSPKRCKTCGAKISWQQRNLIQYCNHSCAAKAINKLRYVDVKYTEVCCEGCNSILHVPPSDQRKTFWCLQCDKTRVKRTLTARKIVSCAVCNKQTKNNKFCTTKCWLDSIRKTKDEYEIYARKCRFKFNVYDYPDFFDIELINNYGWYSPSNKKNNLNGVSRDHCFSVKQGFEQGVDPNIIAHPANCKLLLHRDNQRKNRSCSLTVEQLIKNIKSFEERFSQRPPILVRVSSAWPVAG